MITEETLNTLRRRAELTADTGLVNQRSWEQEWEDLFRSGATLHTVVGGSRVIRDAIDVLICDIEDLGDAQYKDRIRTHEQDGIKRPAEPWIDIKFLTPFPHWVKFCTTRLTKPGELFFIAGDDAQVKLRTFSGYE